MSVFPINGMTYMQFLYGLDNDNTLEARAIYAPFYPDNCLPCSETLTKLHLHLQQTESFEKMRDIIGGPTNAKTPPSEDEVLQIIDEHPETSTRKLLNK